MVMGFRTFIHGHVGRTRNQSYFTSFGRVEEGSQKIFLKHFQSLQKYTKKVNIISNIFIVEIFD